MIKLSEIKEDLYTAVGMFIGFVVGCLFDSLFLSEAVSMGGQGFRFASSSGTAVVGGAFFGAIFALGGLGFSYAVRAIIAELKKPAEKPIT